ncbi:quinone oxidoreductase [Janthinobacterium sp.]|uniref:quinone oxidoreductase family protein n=1 Tax=Janthinobacterium sp. TaxID=1871054 RepID=UPI00293D9C34|nr:quinone oxidoreductase [Janthinobacterium sp.]
MTDIAARIHAHGDAGVIRIDALHLAPPGPGEIQIRHTAIGVNFVDTYHRAGLYRLDLPATLGVEGAGVVEAIGAGVEGLRVGQRIAYADPVPGAYATRRNLTAWRAVALPDEIDDERAAGAMLKGITAHMLFTHVRPLRPGDTLLVHAAAGGLGLVLVQWAKAMGARVIGTVGNRAKAELALAHGLDHAILYREEDFVAATLALTDGLGVHFAVDGIGADTLPRTLAAVRPYGMAASVGQVAGPLGDIDPAWLGPQRSIALARPSVFRFMRDREAYLEGAAATMAQLRAGLRIHIGATLALRDAAEAHCRLEAGDSSGVLLLRP